VNACIDHLVVAAARLEQGVAWCESTLGLRPTAGGQHPLMGTHNRIFDISGPGHARVYFEIIAIDPQAPSPGRPRWFDLDDPALQASVAVEPRLVHFVARCDDAALAVQRLASLGLDRGEVLAAERPTPQGLLRWRITVRPDGQRLMRGALPTLIQWGATHPADHLPDSGVQLQRLVAAASPREAPVLLTAYEALGLRGVAVEPGAGAPLRAELSTPLGPVTLSAWARQT
jgi:catechol 2,3-dioxygenase-like lactoylglutathione lyase family enzyme